VNESPGALVTVTAPAAYGKSTTLALWDAADPRPFAWVNLSPLDDDPVHFLRHVAAAVESIAPLAPEEVALWTGPGRLVDRHLLPAAEVVLAARAPCVLVMDDVHVIRSPETLGALKQLHRSLPRDCGLALAGRAVPAGIVARARVDGPTCELTVTDLALTGDEALQLFHRAGHPLDTEAAEILLQRTEGWVGGLHLAGVVAARHDGGIDAFSGRNAIVADYLVEEVLVGLEPEIISFLEEASLLERVAGPMLDEVLERTGSGSLLEQIEREGQMLLVALDDERRWYRFHALVGDVLRDRVQRHRPSRREFILRRACAWFTDHGDLEAAIAAAVAAGDEVQAVELAITDLVETVQEGRFERLRRRLSLLAPDIIQRSPAGAVAAAWCGLGTGDVALLVKGIDAAQRFDGSQPVGDGSPTLTADVAAIRMMAAPDGLEGTIVDAEKVIAAGPPTVNPWWVPAMVTQAGARVALGDHEAACRQLEAVLPHVRAEPTSAVAALAQLALVAHRVGDPAEAIRRSEQSMAVADRHHLDASLFCTAAYGIAAMIAARVGDADTFHRRRSTTVDLLSRLGPLSARTSMLANLCLADGLLVLGDRPAAQRHLRAAEVAYERDGSVSRQGQDLAELRLRLAGPSATDLGITDAEARVLTLLDSHLSLGEIGEQLFVSRNTVKSHAVAIYRKLGVSSRSDAVRAARRAGLLIRSESVGS
jgi:LuxR family maltose regulon positive regulatory protein